MKQKDRHTDDKTATRPVGFASGKNSLGVLFFICIIIAHYPDLILNLAYVKTDARYQILGHVKWCSWQKVECLCRTLCRTLSQKTRLKMYPDLTRNKCNFFLQQSNPRCLLSTIKGCLIRQLMSKKKGCCMFICETNLLQIIFSQSGY